MFTIDNTNCIIINNSVLFSVVVTDEEGLSSNTSAKVVVSAERDDPPKARITRCGYSDTGSITVRLPMDDLKLCGNASTDDKVSLDVVVSLLNKFFG